MGPPTHNRSSMCNRFVQSEAAGGTECDGPPLPAGVVGSTTAKPSAMLKTGGFALSPQTMPPLQTRRSLGLQPPVRPSKHTPARTRAVRTTGCGSQPQISKSATASRRFVVVDHSGQKLAYIYFEEEAGRRSSAKLLTRGASDRGEYRQAAGAVAHAVVA
jgi:hypothetical protein